MPDTTAHQWQYAITTLPPGDWNFDSGDIDVTTFTLTEDNPDSAHVVLLGYNAVWFSYVPGYTNPGATVEGIRSQSAMIIVTLFKAHPDGTWETINGAVGTQTASFSADFTANNQYYVRVAAADTSETTMSLQMVGSPEAPIFATIFSPPVGIDVGVLADGGSDPPPPSETDAPPIYIKVGFVPTLGDPLTQMLDAPPITTLIGVAPAVQVVDASIQLIQPADEEVVVTDEPEFIVAVTQHDDTETYTVEIQYTDDPLFLTNIETLSADADPLDGAAHFILTQAVPSLTYWRARLLLSGVEQVAWSASQSFTVATPASYDLPVTWSISGGADRPIHFWHFVPDGPHAGDTVTAYGQGFPSSGTITVSTQNIPVVSWDLISPTGNMSSPDRLISGPTVDPEHYEVTFIAPEIEPPGGPFVVGT